MPNIYICRFPFSFPRMRKKDSARAFVQRILQEELHTSLPVRVERQEQGKPYLPDYPDFFFNYSDSGGYAVVATSSHEIGVDMETVRHRPDYKEILKRFFLPEEARMVEEAGGGDTGLSRFFCLWTQKESLLKYIGCGLGGKMHEYKVLGHCAVYAEKKIPLRTYTVQQGQIKPYGECPAVLDDVVITLCTEDAGEPFFAPILSIQE